MRIVLFRDSLGEFQRLVDFVVSRDGCNVLDIAIEDERSFDNNLVLAFRNNHTSLIFEVPGKSLNTIALRRSTRENVQFFIAQLVGIHRLNPIWNASRALDVSTNKFLIATCSSLGGK